MMELGKGNPKLPKNKKRLVFKMRFNIPAITNQVCESLVRLVEDNTSMFVDYDFTEVGEQYGIVDHELTWLLDYKIPKIPYRQLIENIVNHPEAQLCFKVLDQKVREAREADFIATWEAKAIEKEYRDSVI